MIASFSIPRLCSKIMAETAGSLTDTGTSRKSLKARFICSGGRRRSSHCLCCRRTDSGAGAYGKMPDWHCSFYALRFFSLRNFGSVPGYFQAYRNMLPTSISQIVEQTAVAVVALVMANFMVHHFADAPENTLRSWSAAGATHGNRGGVLTALLCFCLSGKPQSGFRKNSQRQGFLVDESYRAVMKTLILIMGSFCSVPFVQCKRIH